MEQLRRSWIGKVMLAASIGAMVCPVVALVVSGCGGDVVFEPTGGGGSGGGTTGTGGGTGASDGATTTMTTAIPPCEALCDYLATSDCKEVLKDCPGDCESHLNAPPPCIDEGDALIACWVQHLPEFECTKLAV